MRTKLLMVMCGALALCACAIAPSTPAGVPVNFVGCSSIVRSLVVPDSGNADAALIVLTLETGFDIAAYGTCTVERLAHPSAMGTVTDGVYHSGQGTFSVALPTPPAGALRPSIDVIQPSVLPSESVLLQTMDDGEAIKSGVVVFGVAMSQETALEQSATVEQAGLEAFHRSNTTPDGLGTDVATLVRHEPVMLDGRPALFAVYSKPSADKLQVSHTYLFAYFTRYEGNSAVLAVLWSGACPVCAEGHEADIRKLEPDIGRLVDSFHLDETALLAWDSANPMPAEKPAPPLPSMAIPSGKAVIYFYREAGLDGRFLDFHIWEKESEIGNLTHGTYLHVAVDPDKHSFMMTTKHDDYSPCPIEVKSGEIRYFEISVSRSAVYGQTLQLSCREPPELETRAKMVDLKDVTDD